MVKGYEMKKPNSLNYKILNYYDVLNFFKTWYDYNDDPLTPTSNHSYHIYAAEEYLNEPDDYEEYYVEFAKLVKQEYGNETILFLFRW